MFLMLLSSIGFLKNLFIFKFTKLEMIQLKSNVEKLLTGNNGALLALYARY